jgi:hypothetical protein
MSRLVSRKDVSLEGPDLCRAIALLCAAALLGTLAGRAEEPRTEPPSSEVAGTAPASVTFPKVWFNTEKKRGWGRSRMTGVLTLTDTELSFSSRKRDVVVPLDSIHRLSYSKMRGDVDTDWILLAVLEEGERRIVGIRDGRKFGYGQHTDEMYETILERFRHVGVAQYDVPRGYRAYDELDGQFTMAIPTDWFTYHRSLINTGESRFWGEVVFSPQPVVEGVEQEPEAREEQRQRVLRTIDDGEIGAFFVDRRETRRGMLCEGFSEKAMQRLQQWIAEDPLFDQGRGIEESVRTEPIVIDGCSGLRFVRHSRRPGEAERVLDLRVISDDEIVFLFGLRSHADRYERDLIPFETAVDSVRLSVAPRSGSR